MSYHSRPGLFWVIAYYVLTVALFLGHFVMKEMLVAQTTNPNSRNTMLLADVRVLAQFSIYCELNSRYLYRIYMEMNL